jgi:hypothetical protein
MHVAQMLHKPCSIIMRACTCAMKSKIGENRKFPAKKKFRQFFGSFRDYMYYVIKVVPLENVMLRHHIYNAIGDAIVRC